MAVLESSEMHVPSGQPSSPQEFTRLNLLYSLLRDISYSIVRTPSSQDFLNQVCQDLVAKHGFSAAWIGWHDRGSAELRVLASACGSEPGWTPGTMSHIDPARRALSDQ